MLGFFPSIRVNELMYSVFARYHVQSGNTVIKDTVNDLFGTKSAYATADFPTYLGHLHEKIKHFDGPKVDTWINKHSLYNYYTNFLPRKQRENIYHAMVNDTRQTTIQTKIGMTTSNVKPFPYFRFCPKCLEEDLEAYGETYWRMTHQLPSVFICLEHDEPIVESKVLIREKNKHEYIKATLENCGKNHQTLKANDKTRKWLEVIAEESQKLATTSYDYNLTELASKYHSTLQSKGYKTVKGHTDHKKLSDDFIHFFGEELLEILQSSVDYDNPHCWLKNIVRKHKKGFHPIRHLLMILFLDETLETVLDDSKNMYHPFGKGPYLCLNKASNHYGKPVIKEVKITRDGKAKLLVGTFECGCGFIYSRRGPDTKESDKFKRGRIKAFGPVFQKKLEEYVHKDKKSYRETARLLGVDTNTVIKYADSKPEPSPITNFNDELEKELGYKQRWIALREENPELSKTELRKLDNAAYTFLYRHDKEWLNENSPEKKKVVYINERVDWDERDRKIKKELERAVEALLNEEKPVRLTVSILGKAFQQLPLLEKKIDKMPLTKAYLEEVTESVDEYQIRRIHWATKELDNENEEIKEWKIMRKAALKPDISDVVRQEVEQVTLSYQLRI
ncbi:TnsD family transposase [Alkalibacillus salilacus]|uniref:Tn7-like transposition protein D n=1 Tax=Alkalibacillus salilacus TaxID=284582 RepID=A0ABT9VEU0_9BACI|nr:TnsD family transposase [Alkalibacillus salilacus]MDQ0159473.1 hypothetical protein [Alkalibacillus salilacus]